MSRHGQHGLSFVSKKLLTTLAPKEARRGLKAISRQKTTTRLSLYPHSFLLLFVSFSQSVVFPQGGTSILRGRGDLAPEFASEILVGAPNFASKV